MSPHWRFRPATLRALGMWVRFALGLLAALVGFVVLAYLVHGAATWD